MLLKIGCALLAGSCCKARELLSMSMSYNLIIVIIKIDICFNNKFYIVYYYIIRIYYTVYCSYILYIHVRIHYFIIMFLYYNIIKFINQDFKKHYVYIIYNIIIL